MRVQFDTDDVPMERRVKQSASLRQGQLCEVEIGAAASAESGPQSPAGVYMLCIVERVEDGILYVRLVSSTQMKPG